MLGFSHTRCAQIVASAAAMSIASFASAGTVTIDFSVEDDFITPLLNGQDISSPPEFGNLLNISTSGNNLGAAIFDSSTTGPNASGGDPDLLVDLGNLLILQDNANPGQTTPGFWDDVDDSNEGGTITFDFLTPVTLSSITLVDIDNSVTATIVLTDSSNLTRTYAVSSNFTFDVDVQGTGGYEVLDLTVLAAQVGEGGGSANAVEDGGFNASDVLSMSVTFAGSAALDNLVFTPIPAPSAMALLAIAGALARRQRRRRHNI